MKDSATGLRFTCCSIVSAGGGAKWLMPLRIPCSSTRLLLRRCCSDESPADWPAISGAGAAGKTSSPSAMFNDPRLAVRSRSFICSERRRPEGMRSGREEADPILLCAWLTLAALLNSRIESWEPRECVPEIRVLDELCAEPREKLEER